MAAQAAGVNVSVLQVRDAPRRVASHCGACAKYKALRLVIAQNQLTPFCEMTAVIARVMTRNDT